MSATDFESVLDHCLDEVLNGRRTFESCLADWPQYADRLEASLRTAMAVRASATSEASPVSARRAEFMAAVHTTPQQSRRRWGLRTPRLSFPTPVLLAPAALVATVALLIVLFRPFGSTSTAEAATLTTFGTVERTDGNAWQVVPDDAALHDGDRLRTSADSSAVLTFSDGSTVTLDPGTEIVLERGYRGTGKPIQLRQLAGRVWTNVATADGSAFRLQTADVTVVPTAAASFETTVGDGETAVNAPEGNVEVQAPGERMLSAPGDVIRARLGQRLVRLNALAVDRGFTVHLSGPLAASLVSPRGLATGATPDGFVFRQIPATLTTDPGGVEGDGQRIMVLAPVEGTYTLLLRRTGDGAGTVLVRAGASEQRIEVPAIAPAYMARLRVTLSGSTVSVQVEGAQSILPARIERAERLVLSETARHHAAEVLKRLRDRRGQPGATPAGR
ncbi:MAG: FecR family protein [Dehalococcoidia bacterium]